MGKKNNLVTPEKQSFTIYDSENVYDDDNIPDVDLPKATDIVLDHIPRRDGKEEE